MCNGSGEVSSQPYRENQDTVEPTEPKRSWLDIPRVIISSIQWKKLGILAVCGVAIFFTLKFIGKKIDKHVKEVEAAEALRIDQQRSLIVQYNDKGEYVRCFVLPQSKNSPISDHYTRINLFGLDPDQNVLKDLGAPTDAKCSYFH